MAARAMNNTVRAATAEAFEVPTAAVSVSMQQDEAPLHVRVTTALPDKALASGTDLVTVLTTKRAALQPRLTHLLGAEVGTLDLTVASIYHPHEKEVTPTQRNRVE
ncbi:hypothetical protein BSR29_07465 [Boudabousia liubingyangii]|uniref:Asp23/Gls24 family envelope stress response protein n=1 Tax=Boudabousia liubingyangii TaxID=1921764 RepID=A0A1Q5PK99_9ACTO|nr:hypothetical protein BSR29_07465 [Boudabousia liubingyangii]